MKNINIKQAFFVARSCGLLRPRYISLLLSYYVATIINALLDGFGMVLLVNLISGTAALMDSNSFMTIVTRIMGYFGVVIGFKAVLWLTVAIFSSRVILSFFIWMYDGMSAVYIKKHIQEHGFSVILRGDWEALRNIRVGQRVGAIMDEAVITTKYITSFTQLIYFFVTALVLMCVAFTVNLELTSLLLCMGFPILMLLKYLFVRQASLSALQMTARQNFTADIAERLNTLFQIKVDGNNNHYIKDGLKSRAIMTKIEVLMAIWHSVTATFTVLLPVIGLSVFYLWMYIKGRSVDGSLHFMAGIGLIGARILTQINGLVASWGNVSCFSGSILPVYDLFTIPQETKRSRFNERLKKVILSGVSYKYSSTKTISDINVSLEDGMPLLIKGPSGSGKTTIANLMAGVLKPHSGQILYVGESGSNYEAARFKANVGYVTQDIHLFHGTIRDNIRASRKDVDDMYILECLKTVGADRFVNSLGGLDAVITEAGRSLSGGERRRLGIARVLAGRPDFIIFDEVTAGLDDDNKDLIRNTVMDLSKHSIVSVITHEDVFDDIENRVNIA